jgi:hypothetical protein
MMCVSARAISHLDEHNFSRADRKWCVTQKSNRDATSLLGWQRSQANTILLMNYGVLQLSLYIHRAKMLRRRRATSWTSLHSCGEPRTISAGSSPQ